MAWSAAAAGRCTCSATSTVSWQNMLSRTTNTQGQFAVGFISVPNYSYRLVVLASSSAWAGRSGTVTTTTPNPAPPKPPAGTCGAPVQPDRPTPSSGTRCSLHGQPAAGICNHFTCRRLANGVGYLVQARRQFSMSGGRRSPGS